MPQGREIELYLNTYTGEFMTQYSWAEFVAGYLDRITTSGSPNTN